MAASDQAGSQPWPPDGHAEIPAQMDSTSHACHLSSAAKRQTMGQRGRLVSQVPGSPWGVQRLPNSQEWQPHQVSLDRGITSGSATLDLSILKRQGLQGSLEGYDISLGL